jgi:DNA-binding SARP family transcriptional activator
MAALSVHLFGQPRFEFGGEAFKFAAPPKTLPLLAYLVLHRAGPVSREKIAFTLWEDETEDDARANLRRHLHHLQRALPQTDAQTPWILADVDSLQWNPAALAWLDVAEFERRAADRDDRARAIDVYAGDLLENLYEEWLFADRDRLRNVYQSLLGDLILESRSTRDLARAASYAQKVLANDPWREDTVRQLMAIRYESGDRAGALAVYQQFDQRLRREMDVDPMPETSALRDAILRNEPLPTPAGIDAASSAAATPLLPFVGRDSEMEQLRVLWSRAARGRGSVVLVGGEAGIGKSRLAFEFALLAEAQGARVMTGATPYPESAPYQAIAEAFRSVAPLLASVQVEPMWLGVAAQAVPELRARIPELPIPPKVEPERERLRLFEAFSMCLEALARPRPTVLILEDAHWAGEASIAALEFLARRLVRLPVLMIVTYRDEETPRGHPLRRARRELQEEHVLSTVSPRHLERDAIAELAKRLPAIAVADGSSDLPEALLQQSAGNPLFLGEVIRNLLERSDADNGRPLVSATQAIAMRVARLTESSRALAEVASIIGQGFDVDVVRDVTGWGENDVLDALSDLIDRHIVKDTGGRSGYAYAFSHHVIQSTIYAGVSEQTKVHRHRRVARVLEENYRDRAWQFAADVARHYDLGHEPEQAAGAWLTAGRYAHSVYAYDEALRYLGRSLELASMPEIRADALLLRESILARRGDRSGQRSDLEELDRLRFHRDSVEFACDLLRRRASLARAVGERETERALVDEFLALSEKSGSERLLAAALIADAAYGTVTGDHEHARRSAEKALELYRRLDDLTGQLEARCRLVEIAFEGGAFELASPLLADARAAAAKAGNTGLLARAITSATHAAISEQRYATCRELALEARELYRVTGDREGEADVITRQASAAARLSLLDEARQCYDDARAIYEAIGKRLGVAAVLANGGIHSVRLGLLDDAQRSLQSALEQFRVLKDVRGQTACEVNLSYIHLIRGQADEAKLHALRAFEMAHSIAHAGYEAASLANLGGAERDLGEFEAAIEHMEAGLAIRRRLNTPDEYADDLAQLALLYVLANRVDHARALGDELKESLQRAAPTIFMPQFTYWAAAQVFRALGKRPLAKETLGKAHAIAMEQASAIAPGDAKNAYLALSVNREIDAAFKSKGWTSVPVATPRPR